MKQVNLKQNFKKTARAPSASQHLVGKKRESVTYPILTVEDSDVPQLEPKYVSTIINQALESYAKSLFADNQFNWDYVPPIDKVTVEEVYNDITRERAGYTRTLTNEKLQQLADIYQDIAAKPVEEHGLGKTQKSATLGAKLIQARLTPILGNPGALGVFADNLGSLSDLPAITEHDDKESLEQVIEALLKIIADALEVEVTSADL